MTREQQITQILTELETQAFGCGRGECANPDISDFTQRIMDLDMFQPGTKVMYAPEHYGCDMSRWEKGIVKAYGPEAGKYFVVYNCGGEWDHYQDYTAALTSVSDLRLGWR